MIVHGTATHQLAAVFKLLQVPLQPSTMNQSPLHNGSCKRQLPWPSNKSTYNPQVPWAYQICALASQ